MTCNNASSLIVLQLGDVTQPSPPLSDICVTNSCSCFSSYIGDVSCIVQAKGYLSNPLMVGLQHCSLREPLQSRSSHGVGSQSLQKLRPSCPHKELSETPLRRENFVPSLSTKRITRLPQNRGFPNTHRQQGSQCFRFKNNLLLFTFTQNKS